MDVEALESEAQSAIARAASLAELEEVRVRYLGRKSALKQALREVRDRETGMTLNAVRERLEQDREAGVGTLQLAPMAWTFRDRREQLRLVAELLA